LSLFNSLLTFNTLGCLLCCGVKRGGSIAANRTSLDGEAAKEKPT
jgi:hypothetical protein